MRILITNDDGILAPGLAALYHATHDLGQVDVVAPADVQSATSHAISVKKPMAVQRVHVNNDFHGWSVAGRPADCVKLAMIELLDARPDVVLSGINAGANTGVNVLYSGTVAAAREGALFGVPSVAFSLELSEELDFTRAARYARQVLDAILASGPSDGSCLNVNIPALDRGTPRGVRCCHQAPVSWEEHYRQQPEPDGRTIYWLDGWMRDPEENSACDMGAIRDGYISVTPLHADLTDHRELTTIQRWAWPTQLSDPPPFVDRKEEPRGVN